MYFTAPAYGCSIASVDMTCKSACVGCVFPFFSHFFIVFSQLTAFPSPSPFLSDLSGSVVYTAKKGDLIKMTCDDVFCPTPRRPDCYELQSACGPNEWCWINQHEKWGPWSMGGGGTTYPLYDKDTCSAETLATLEAYPNGTDKDALLQTFKYTCETGIALDAAAFPPSNFPEIWKPIRGQCLEYRQVKQSCLDEPLSFSDPEFNPVYNRYPSEKTFYRPLVCDPMGGKGGGPLACTGPDYDVLPNTCVDVRPKDICLQGPWWDSSDCPRTQAAAPPGGGLTRPQLLIISQSLITLFPGEVGFSGTCTFWDANSVVGKLALRYQNQIANILTTLWPIGRGVGDAAPTLNQIINSIPGLPGIIADPQRCYDQENVPGSQVAGYLANLGALSTQPNKVWSAVHFLMHNQPSPMSPRRVNAAVSIVSFLLEAFWCDDCRGFFYDLVEKAGPPPHSNDPYVHQRWWWRAHNLASEHVASTRGGHPWIHQLGQSNVEEYQNPFFMEWATAVKQWTNNIVGACHATLSDKLCDLFDAKMEVKDKLKEAVSADAKGIAAAATQLKEEASAIVAESLRAPMP